MAITDFKSSEEVVNDNAIIVMGLVEDFPANPFIPSLRYAATQLTPLRLPCGRKPIRLGSTLAISCEPDTKSSLTDTSAFSHESLANSKIAFTPVSSGEVSQSSACSAQSAEKHMSFSIHGEIGGNVLGAEMQAQYEAHVANSHSNITAISKSSYTSGTATFSEIPRLCSTAVQLLEASPDPVQAFKERYGEYYVAAYMLGGSNVTHLSALADQSAESKGFSAKVKVKVLFFSKTVGISQHEDHASSMVTTTLSAFDTLSGWTANKTAYDTESYHATLSEASNNGIIGYNLPTRVMEKVDSAGLTSGQELSWKACEQIFRQGLVTEIILLPYERLRQFNEAVLANYARSKSVHA